MIDQTPVLSISEAKNKELVPCLGGAPLHSLHNPRREAEVFASNHLAHLYKSPNALVLGLGFGYHIEEIAKILKLKHKHYRIAVVEAVPELCRLVTSYRGEMKGVEIYTSRDVDSLWTNPALGLFLLEKPVVLIHSNSFALSKPFYESFLARRAPLRLGDWKIADPELQTFFKQHESATVSETVAAGEASPSAAWMRAYWECKHAD